MTVSSRLYKILREILDLRAIDKGLELDNPDLLIFCYFGTDLMTLK